MKKIRNRFVHVYAIVGIALFLSVLVVMGNAFAQGAVTPNPRIEVVKVANTTIAQVGDVVTYTYTVLNTGNVTLTSVSIVDDKLGGISLPTTTLAPTLSGSGTTILPGSGGTNVLPGVVTAVASVIVTEAMGDPLVNTVFAIGTAPDGTVVNDSSRATVDIIGTGGGGETATPEPNTATAIPGDTATPITLTPSTNTPTPEGATPLPNTLTPGPGDTATPTLDPDVPTATPDPDVPTATPDPDVPTLTPTPDTPTPGPGTLTATPVLVSFGNIIYHDLNGNGIKDGDDEIGLAGVRVFLIGPDGGDVQTTMTDSNGLYRFDGLMPGAYSVSVDINSLPADKQESFTLTTDDPDGGMGGVAEFNVSAGGIVDVLGQNFGFFTGGYINGNVQSSLSFTNTAAMKYITNALINLTNSMGDVITTTTDSEGNYSFNNIPNGTYTITLDVSTLPTKTQTLASNTITDRTVDVNDNEERRIDFLFQNPTAVALTEITVAPSLLLITTVAIITMVSAVMIYTTRGRSHYKQ